VGGWVGCCVRVWVAGLCDRVLRMGGWEGYGFWVGGCDGCGMCVFGRWGGG
jgi:hypothetical protein